MSRFYVLLAILAVLAVAMIGVYSAALADALARPAVPALAGEDLDGVVGSLGADAGVVADGAEATERADL